MNKIKLALVAAVGFLFLACGSKADKTDVDFSLIPIKGANGEYQYIDMKQNGKIAINPQFGEAHFFRDGLALVKISGKDGKWGYIDKEGKYAIAPTYSVAQDFSEGVAWVQMEDQPPMLIDKEGKMLLQMDSLVSALPFHNGMSAVKIYEQEWGSYNDGFIDKQGKMIITAPSPPSGISEFVNKQGKWDYKIHGESIKPFISEDLYAFQSWATGKWGFKNSKEETVINPQFDDAFAFVDGVAEVVSDEKWGAIDNKGNFIIYPKYDSLSYDGDGLFIVKVGNKWGFVNKKNEFVVNPQFDLTFGFLGNELAAVQMGSKWAYIDRKGKIAVNPQFDLALPFLGDYAMVMSGGKFGFINQKGEYIVPPLYDVDAKDAQKYLLEYTLAITEKKYNAPSLSLLALAGISDQFLPYAKRKDKTEGTYGRLINNPSDFRIKIDKDAIFVGKRKIANTADVAKQEALLIDALAKELESKRDFIPVENEIKIDSKKRMGSKSRGGVLRPEVLTMLNGRSEVDMPIVLIFVSPDINYNVLYKAIATSGLSGFTNVYVRARIDGKYYNYSKQEVYSNQEISSREWYNVPPPDDNALNLTVALTKDYIEVFARGSSLPKIFFKEHKNSDGSIELQTLHKESLEDPGKILYSVYSKNDSIYLDGNKEFISELSAVSLGSIVSTLGESSARRLACGQSAPGLEDICVDGKPAIVRKPRSAYDELARLLITIHNRFIDSPDADYINIFADADTDVSKVILVAHRAREAGFFRPYLTNLNPAMQR